MGFCLFNRNLTDITQRLLALPTYSQSACQFPSPSPITGGLPRRARENGSQLLRYEENGKQSEHDQDSKIKDFQQIRE